MQVASREENQQLAALAVAATATVFCHFRTYYKLNIVSIYILMDSRLKCLSIESNNIQNEVRMKKLWSSEVGGLTLCRGYAIAWKTHAIAYPRMQGLRNCVPEGCQFEPSHAIAWISRTGIPESSLEALVHANF